MRYETLRAEYVDLWESMELVETQKGDVLASAKRLVAGKKRYQKIEESLGVPWWMVGLIHLMEAGGRWDRHMHNGDPLTARTRQVPKNRPKTGEPPFTWEESALDALKHDGLHKVRDWPVSRVCYVLEGFNGWGYQLYHQDVPSPYLWSKTKHYTRGKYVADGKWSSSAVSKQSGAMAILKAAMELDKSIRMMPERAANDDADEKLPKTGDDATITSMAESTTGQTAVGMGGTGISGMFARAFEKLSAGAASVEAFLLALLSDPIFWGFAFVLAGSVYVWMERRKKLIKWGF